jgi:hypothetical protein
VPNGVTNPGNVASFSASVAGSYGVTVTNGSGCSGKNSGTLTVNPNPTVTVNSPTVCASALPATITASPSPAGSYTYVWTVPNGVTNPGNVASFSATVAGNYGVTITNGNSCSGSGSGTLTVNANPTASILSVACTLSGSIVLHANGSGGSGTGYTFKWSTGETTQEITVSTPGVTYSVTVTDSNNCASGSTSVRTGLCAGP